MELEEVLQVLILGWVSFYVVNISFRHSTEESSPSSIYIESINQPPPAGRSGKLEGRATTPAVLR